MIMIKDNNIFVYIESAIKNYYFYIFVVIIINTVTIHVLMVK